MASTPIRENFLSNFAYSSYSVFLFVFFFVYTASMIKIPDSEWKTKLTPEQYSVCREKGTEPVSSNKTNLKLSLEATTGQERRVVIGVRALASLYCCRVLNPALGLITGPQMDEYLVISSHH